jgi:single-strand DNA-binding protein
MASLNKVTLIGHTGKDVEMRYTADGRGVASVSLATSENWKDKKGEWQSATEWHNVTAWEHLAERMEHIKKGTLIFVEGKIKTNQYTDRDGVNRRQITIVASRILTLSPKEKREAGDVQKNPGNGQYGPGEFGDDDFIPEVEDDDVPL